SLQAMPSASSPLRRCSSQSRSCRAGSRPGEQAPSTPCTLCERVEIDDPRHLNSWMRIGWVLLALSACGGAMARSPADAGSVASPDASVSPPDDGGVVQPDAGVVQSDAGIVQPDAGVVPR